MVIILSKNKRIIHYYYSNSVLFASNGFFQRNLLAPQIPHASQLDRVALAGSLSGVIMAVVNCPVELFKIRLQVQDHNNRVRQNIKATPHCDGL